MTITELIQAVSGQPLSQFLGTPYGKADAKKAEELYKAGTQYLRDDETEVPQDQLMEFAIAPHAAALEAMQGNFFAEPEPPAVMIERARLQAMVMVKEAIAQTRNAGEVVNKGDYPEAKWVEPVEIGTVGNNALYLVGYEFELSPQPAESVLVSVGRGAYRAESLISLLSGQEPVNIPEPLPTE
jgi:hypothetical protein